MNLKFLIWIKINKSVRVALIADKAERAVNKLGRDFSVQIPLSSNEKKKNNL